LDEESMATTAPTMLVAEEVSAATYC